MSTMAETASGQQMAWRCTYCQMGFRRLSYGMRHLRRCHGQDGTITPAQAPVRPADAQSSREAGPPPLD